MKELNLKIESKEVKAEVRPLRVEWTREMASDLEISHGLSIENLLEDLIKRENRKKSIKNIFTD
jgi:hypothetical protein